MQLSYKNKYSNSETGYYLKKYNIHNYNIDLGVQATYVIHLIGNGRLKSIENQLNEYKITGKTYILYNEGYKCGKKESHINESASDLIDAYLYIFKHAVSNSFDNILILEDDYFFDKKIISYQNKINRFLRESKCDLYYLGCLPYIRHPINDYHSRLYLSTGTHAVIYSNSLMKKILQLERVNIINNISDWDILLTMFKRYMSSIPVCYQLFPETLNRKSWGKGLMVNNFIGNMVKQVVQKQIELITYMHLDKTHLIGYPFFYTISEKNYSRFFQLYENQKMRIKNIKNKLYINSIWIFPK